MPNTQILAVTCCALVFSTAAFNYGLGQADVPKPHRLPIESFPAQIGSWTAGPVESQDIDIQKQLPTAKIVDRVYRNPLGQEVDLMLLTATEDEDMHSPKACFPSQGWTLSNVQNVKVDGQPATRMSAQIDGDSPKTVLYWLTGYYPPAPPRNALFRTLEPLRTRIMGPHNNMSLFVRLIASNTPLGREALTDFTASLHAPIQSLIGAGASPIDNDMLHRKF